MSAKLQLARLGGTKDYIEVDLNMTCAELVQKIADMFELEKTSMKLLCKGKMLKHDETKSLLQLNIKNDDKLILMNKPNVKKPMENYGDNNDSSNNNSNSNGNDNGYGADYKEKSSMDSLGNANGDDLKTSYDGNLSSLLPNALESAATRMERLEEIKKAAEKMAARSNDGFDWTSRRYFEINNQFGERVHMPEKDRQALTMGLTLHEKAKVYQKQKQYEDALYLMQLAFESFSQVDQKWLDIIDNYGLVCLDIVWLYYLKQDEKQISQAHQWLQIAEQGLKKAHGKNMERLKQLRGTGFTPELALYVRLNILKALQSLYQNDMAMAQSYIIKAETDWRRLQISDRDLAEMQNMGFTEKEATRALRLCQSNVEEAIQHVFAKRNEARQREEDEQRRLAERARARRYGKTKGNKFVNIEMLDKLKGIGIHEEIAVEALKQTDNHYEHTMEHCFDTQKRLLLLTKILQRSMRLNADDVQCLQTMGFSEARARAALIATSKSLTHAIKYLTNPNTAQQEQVDRLEAEITAYMCTLEMLKPKPAPEPEPDQKQEIEQKKANNENSKDVEMADKERDAHLQVNDQENNTSNNNNDSQMEMTPETEAEDEADAETEANEKEPEQERGLVDPMDLDSATAFPNPHLGDVVPDAAPENEDAVKLTDDFEDVTMGNPLETHEEEKILNDLDDVDDPDAYLDLELIDEKQALEQLKTLLQSMGGSL